MKTYDPAITKQQARRRAFLAERNFMLGHGAFLVMNLVFWCSELFI